MKKTFPGYFPQSKRELERLWKTCIFTVDANILLNLYRYSDETRKEFLRILDTIKERLWLPHQAAQEYLDKRLTVIAQQEKAYENSIKTINELEQELSNVRQHPFIGRKLMEGLAKTLQQVVDELGQNKAIHSKRADQDEVQESIGELFAGKVGLPYATDRLAAICREGEDRYARKIPPGYKDNDKTESGTSPLSTHKKYGDLIIWQQILEKGGQEKKNIIFVTDDKKEDWWLIFKGKTLGPRPELIQEFAQSTQGQFHMYQSDRFLEFAAQHFKQHLRKEIVDEIRDLRVQDVQKQRRRTVIREEKDLVFAIRHLDDRIREVKNRLASLYGKRRDLRRRGELCLEQADKDGPDSQQLLEQYMDYDKREQLAAMEIAQLRNELGLAAENRSMLEERLNAIKSYRHGLPVQD